MKPESAEALLNQAEELINLLMEYDPNLMPIEVSVSIAKLGATVFRLRIEADEDNGVEIDPMRYAVLQFLSTDLSNADALLDEFNKLQDKLIESAAEGDEENKVLLEMLK